jgi:hypothetical protein
MRKSVIISGFVLVIMVIAISIFIFHPLSSSESCSPPPTPLFHLINLDNHTSHSVSVVVKDGADNVLSRESYVLVPSAGIRSTFMISDETSSEYHLSFLVDDTVTSEVPVTASYYHIPELSVDPVQKTVNLDIYPLTGDYGCNVSR